MSWMMTIILLVCCATNSYAASTCAQSHLAIKQKLLDFKQELLVINSSKSFQVLLHNHYDDISLMLVMLEGCDHSIVEENPEITIMIGVLRDLRADARQLAFSEYNNWLYVKNEEIALFEKIDGMINNKK